MKVLKKITILVLAVAMAFSVNVTGTFTESVKAATEFQITSPSDNGLVAAGYIDIKWNNPVGGSASKYNVYVDGNYVQLHQQHMNITQQVLHTIQHGLKQNFLTEQRNIPRQ